MKDACRSAVAAPVRSARLGGRDRPGHDDQRGCGSPHPFGCWIALKPMADASYGFGLCQGRALRARRGAAAPWAVLDQVQGRSKLADMDLRRRPAGPLPGERAPPPPADLADPSVRHPGRSAHRARRAGTQQPQPNRAAPRTVALRGSRPVFGEVPPLAPTPSCWVPALRALCALRPG